MISIDLFPLNLIELNYLISSQTVLVTISSQS